ncbi:MAG: hypothetical protein QGH76_04950, partial [Phycisphaerales bacterium]|nr:hypothetical protein [Phycisphaerales bacterium]
RALAARSGLDLPPTGAAIPVFAHRILILDGIPCSALTRISQTDGTSPDRPGRIAHHLILSAEERPSIGPVSLLRSGWFFDTWDESANLGSTPAPLPNQCEAFTPPNVDPEWMRILVQRVTAHAPTAIVVPTVARCIDVLAAIEQSLPTGRAWEFSFLTDTRLKTDGVLLLAAQSDTPAADFIANRYEGVVLSLHGSPTSSTPPLPHHEAEKALPDRVELLPAAMDADSGGLSAPVLLLIVLAMVAVSITIAVLGGWMT